MPSGGAGKYDLKELATLLVAQNPQYASQLTNVPKDPLLGTETESYYRYVVTNNGKCVRYSNLERESEPVMLLFVTSGTAGGGVGVFQSENPGWNNSTKYFQYSN